MKIITALLLIITSSFGQNDYTISLDGIGTPPDHLTNATANWRSLDQAGSVSAWIYPTDLTNMMVVLSSSNNAFGSVFWRIQTSTGGQIGVHVRNIFNDQIWSNTTTMLVNNWYHIVITCDGSDYKIYINNVLQEETVGAGADNGNWLADVSGRDDITVGYMLDITPSNPFIGQIDEVRYFNTVLTTEQIADLYGSGTPNTLHDTTGQIHYWNFEEGSGASTSDQVGSATLSFQGDPAWTAATLGWIDDLPATESIKGFKEYNKFPKFKSRK